MAVLRFLPCRRSMPSVPVGTSAADTDERHVNSGDPGRDPGLSAPHTWTADLCGPWLRRSVSGGRSSSGTEPAAGPTDHDPPGRTAPAARGWPCEGQGGRGSSASRPSTGRRRLLRGAGGALRGRAEHRSHQARRGHRAARQGPRVHASGPRSRSPAAPSRPPWRWGRGGRDWYHGCVVAYSPTVKYDLLGVTPGPLVTERCAVEMVTGAVKVLEVDAAVSTTGAGGPGPEEGKRAGTVHVGLYVRGEVYSHMLELDGGPGEVVEGATEKALGLLWRRCAQRSLPASTPRRLTQFPERRHRRQRWPARRARTPPSAAPGTAGSSRYSPRRRRSAHRRSRRSTGRPPRRRRPPRRTAPGGATRAALPAGRSKPSTRPGPVDGLADREAGLDVEPVARSSW